MNGDPARQARRWFARWRGARPPRRDPRADQAVRDRAALESVVGHPLSPTPWPADALPPGCRVRVVQDLAWPGPWAQPFLGVVDTLAAPDLVTHPMARPGEFGYFIEFDEPQLDSDGMGPYRRAHIWGRYVEPVPD